MQVHTLRWLDGTLAVPPTKIVCVGRNYAAHAQELGNPVPQTPLVFCKPTTALADLAAPIVLPDGLGPIDHELELALVLARPLTRASVPEALSAIAGVAIALDLTARSLQSELKRAGHPWERAKGFDGACPLSPLIAIDQVGALEQLELRLSIDGRLRQHARSELMLMPPGPLLAELSRVCTLLAGDLVLCGTPEGVGPLVGGQCLEVEMDGVLRLTTHIAGTGDRIM